MKPQLRRRGVFLRRLTESDLGLFAACRPKIQSKQRAININAAIAEAMLPRDARRRGEIQLFTKRFPSGPLETRLLKKTHKNWRLGGRKIEGGEFACLAPDDWFIPRYEVDDDRNVSLTWRTVSRSSDSELWGEIEQEGERRLVNGMMHLSETHPDYELLQEIAFTSPAPRHPAAPPTLPQGPAAIAASPSASPTPPMPPVVQQRPPRQKSVRERIREPHILAEMMRTAADLSAGVQLEFFEVMARLADELRAVLVATRKIQAIPFSHRNFWPRMRGRAVTSIDGGLANIQALGSAPIAIRVGIYRVIPGVHGDDREDFRVGSQLVDELYAQPPAGVFSSWFPDRGALRDAARISVEAAAAVGAVQEDRELEFLLLHGALVNPASRYSDITAEHGQIIVEWPPFTSSSLGILLLGASPPPEGRDAKFIAVYQKQLAAPSSARSVVCGVVERPGATSSVTQELVQALADDEIRPLIAKPPERWKREFMEALEAFGITDQLLFHCVLQENETTIPIAVDRNEERRAPRHWIEEIRAYPKPHVAFMLPSDRSPPVRWEIFDKDLARVDEIAALLLHSAKLLPGYAFPVGLDIVDKYAKVPNWMARPISARLAADVLQRAMTSGDPGIANAVRRLLTSSRREWFLRPRV